MAALTRPTSGWCVPRAMAVAAARAHAPQRFPGRASWDVFAEVLEGANVVTTPGSGFGPAGEGFLRFSSFGHRQDVEEACRRLVAHFGKGGK